MLMIGSFISYVGKIFQKRKKLEMFVFREILREY